jgi:hypothetical protein
MRLPATATSPALKTLAKELQPYMDHDTQPAQRVCQKDLPGHQSAGTSDIGELCARYDAWALDVELRAGPSATFDHLNETVLEVLLEPAQGPAYKVISYFDADRTSTCIVRADSSRRWTAADPCQETVEVTRSERTITVKAPARRLSSSTQVTVSAALENARSGSTVDTAPGGSRRLVVIRGRTP